MEKSNQEAMNHLLTEINDMLEMIETYTGPVKPLENPSINKHEIEMIGKFVEGLNDFCESLSQGEEMETLKRKKAESPSVDANEKQFFLRAQEIEKRAEMLQKTFSKSLAKMRRKKRTKKGEKGLSLEQKNRRKLFKTIGGDKKWIPL